MKSTYEKAQIEIIKISDSDILTASKSVDNGIDTPEDSLDW